MPLLVHLLVCRMPEGPILRATKDDITHQFYDYQMIFYFHLAQVGLSDLEFIPSKLSIF